MLNAPVYAEVEHAWVVIKHVLNAVAVMNIPVHNKNTIDSLAGEEKRKKGRRGYGVRGREGEEDEA